MEFFEEDNNELIVKKKIEENYEKQAKRTKLILTIVFSILGCVFLALGAVLGIIFKVLDEELLSICLSAPFAFVGIFMLIMLIVARLLPTKCDYEKMKKRIQNTNTYNANDLFIRLTFLEAKNENLESRVKYLEEELKKIK